MKARKVRGLDRDEALADNAQRIIATRLDELMGFMPRASDPAEVDALHDLRIAAKRLRYVLELTHPCFGPYAKAAIKRLRDLQDLVGEIHDVDVAVPDVAALRRDLEREDAAALANAAIDARLTHLDLACAEGGAHRADLGGLAALEVGLLARRAVLHAAFGQVWVALERDGFASRLRYAIGERAA